MAISQAPPIGTLFPANGGTTLRRNLPAILVAAIFAAVILFAAFTRGDSSSEANTAATYQSSLPVVSAAKPSPLHPITARTSRGRSQH